MPTARWNGAVIAESDDTVLVEGNHYFPPESVNTALLEASQPHAMSVEGRGELQDDPGRRETQP
jgi:uncharacterized protein (DUF427 family)